MIYDLRKHLPQYLPEPVRSAVRGHLEALTPESPDGDFPVGEDGIVARVMGYMTRPEEEMRLEAHRRFVDVQCVLSGAERARRYQNQRLEVQEAYDRAADVEFYGTPSASSVTMELSSETFAIFFPQDAHAGQLPVGQAGQPVRKVVYKVPLELFLRPGAGSASA